MQNKLNSIVQPLLMGPGPSCVSESVYQALAIPTLGHLDPEFIALMDDIKGYIRKLIKTDNQLTVPISGTGSAGMETCFVNLIEQGDKVLVLINGVFGTRMEDVAQRLGAEVDSIKFEWGTPVILDTVRKQLAQKNYDLVAVVHAETSTGVCNPVAEIGKLVIDNGALYLVDCVTSMGGMEVKMDDWNIDALYSGTQKCLSCPPGLSPVSFSDRAVGKLTNRKTKVPNWYLDLSMITQYWSGSARVYHHTAPINMLYGLYQACFSILEEGLENVIKRHNEMHILLVSELKILGLELFVEESVRLPMLNAIKIPNGVDDAGVRSRLLKDCHIEIGGGLGPLAGKIWRIGLMGETAKKENIQRLMDALKTMLR
ncbi:MAG: alanine--glyoxylate aminotransferase family protein [Candidatus Marinimicrobia bacterium]|nr:alanine--glyoxylate aminotransferase family protein [Candidatus Neomarinimicrobiota bacterium]